MDIPSVIEKLNWQTVISMFVVGWYFTREIRSTLVKMESDLTAQGARTDRLYEMFCDMQKQMASDTAYMKDEMLEMKKEHYKFMNSQRMKK